MKTKTRAQAQSAIHVANALCLRRVSPAQERQRFWLEMVPTLSLLLKPLLKSSSSLSRWWEGFPSSCGWEPSSPGFPLGFSLHRVLIQHLTMWVLCQSHGLLHRLGGFLDIWGFQFTCPTTESFWSVLDLLIYCALPICPRVLYCHALP